MLTQSRLREFLKQWEEKQRRGEVSSGINAAEIALLILYDAWVMKYKLYEEENQQFREGKLAGMPVYEEPKI